MSVVRPAKPTEPTEPTVHVVIVEKCECGSTYQCAGTPDPAIYGAWINRHLECGESK